MKILYYDCFAGISGDMNLAALIDAGLDEKALESELGKLGLDGWRLNVSKSSKCGIFGTRVDVECGDHHHDHHHNDDDHHHHHGEDHHHGDSHGGHCHRKFSDISRMISDSRLSERVKSDSLKIFTAIAEAEAKVHGVDVADVSFHEVGAVDSIVDIVGCAVALELLGIDEVASSSVELGGGTVKCAHGILPVPAPATALLAKSFPSKIGGARHECTTPTGAAIIAALGKNFSPKIDGRLIAEGFGIGHRDCDALPNVLRVLVYETADIAADDKTVCGEMFELSANIDDMTPEHISSLCEKLFAAGALDVWCENIVMKKNRCAVKVCALSRPGEKNKICESFFRNSTTLGIRENKINRISLPRSETAFDSSIGTARFKKYGAFGVVRAKPEFEDCKKISNSSGMPIDLVSDRLKNEFGK